MGRGRPGILNWAASRRGPLLYLFFGGLSFILNAGSYAVFRNMIALPALAANLLAWVITVAFVYETNQRWVFPCERKRGAEWRRRIFAFYAGRIVTLLAEEALLAVFAVWLGFPGMAVKIAAQVIVILLNYFISKHLIFKGP